MRFLLLVLALFAAPAIRAEPAAGDSGKAAIPITKMTLPNGLRVVIAEQHRVPAVAHILWVDTGSADDPRGKSGLSHYLEHMLFKGTPKLGEEEYNAKVEALGGEHNAFTNQDVTAYYVLAAKEHLPEVMALESERFTHWHPKEDSYAAEKQVIIEERRLRIENQPTALLGEAMMAALYQNHPYHTPVIGWMNEMEGLAPDDVKHWFSTYYQPKNATLMLVGDITPAEGKALASKYFSAWKGTAALPSRLWAEEPVRRSAARVTLRNASVQQPLWQRYYQGPSLLYGKKDEVVPLMLLAQVLGAERTGILYKKLVVEQKKATAVDVGYSGYSRGPDTFVVSLAPAPGVTLDDLGRAYETALREALKDGGIAEDELARARTGMKAATVFARDGLQGFAFILADLEMLGLPPSVFTDLPRAVDTVSLVQMLAAGRDVLDDTKATTGYLLPMDRDVATKAVTNLQPAGGSVVH